MSIAEIIAELTRLSPDELAKVQAKVNELVESPPTAAQGAPVAGHPAIGMWKDRTDLPDDAVAASKFLRGRMMRRTDKAA